MKAWILVIQIILKLVVRLILQPRHGSVGTLDLHEVEKVYDREARTYDEKHHLTTRGMDTTWRRLAGWCVVTAALKNDRCVQVLDLCTGTGLTVHEMLPVLRHWNIRGSITGLDYNENMLQVARKREFTGSDISVQFVRGDAMNLTGSPESASIDGLMKFSANSMDVVTQMFGIGGINRPMNVFREVLKVLKPDGTFFLIDMHEPIQDQAGEWPLFMKWLRFPKFEAVTYFETTLPLVLNRLWGWRDTTADFYQLQHVSYCDDSGQYWGFEIQSFEIESQRWWWALPIMPTAKMIVCKTAINREQHEANRKVLSVLSC